MIKLTDETLELISILPSNMQDKIKFNNNEPVNILVIIKALNTIDGFPLSEVERTNVLNDFSKLSGYSIEELEERSTI